MRLTQTSLPSKGQHTPSPLVPATDWSELFERPKEGLLKAVTAGNHLGWGWFKHMDCVRP
jgi:hypothetical protein